MKAREYLPSTTMLVDSSRIGKQMSRAFPTNRMFLIPAVTLLLSTLSCAPDTETSEQHTEADHTEGVADENSTTTPDGEGTGGTRSWAPWSLSFERVDTMFSSEAHMIELFGRQSISRGTIHVGEGEKVPATILFAGESGRELKVSWHDRQRRRHPEQIVIEGTGSEWFLSSGLRTGIDLDSLRRLNERAFEMSGFEWDYGGTVVDWKGGKIEKMEREDAWLVVRTVRSDSGKAAVSEEEMRQIVGDRLISSENGVLKRVNPVVRTIIMVFAPPEPPAEDSEAGEQESEESTPQEEGRDR